MVRFTGPVAITTRGSGFLHIQLHSGHPEGEAMRRILIVCLFLAATSAHAEHIWRLWCGKPLIARKGVFDTADECTSSIAETKTMLEESCKDTDHGPVWTPSGKPALDGRLRTCAEAIREQGTCECKPEAVEHETK
jgi:hypothetical protein